MVFEWCKIENKHEKRLLTIKEKYEAGDYTLSELHKAIGCHFKLGYVLPL